MNVLPKRHTGAITFHDQFCGAGGNAVAAKELGLEGVVALNHWPLAIESHNTNHPEISHDCTDVQACDPLRYRSADILITSPECTNHSLAKGKRRKYRQMADLFGKVEIDPSEERSRATMWDVVRFTEAHRYQLVIVENVVDVRRWEPYDAWLRAMHSLGYLHKEVYLNAQFCPPTPQSRDRWYCVFWRKGNPAPNLTIEPVAWCPPCEANVHSVQSWKNNRTWGKYRQQYVYRCPRCAAIVEPYRHAAFDCIDWSIPAKKIGERKRPLKPRTLQRIEYGLERYGRQPVVITTRYTSGLGCRVRPAAGAPLPTQPGDAAHGVSVLMDPSASPHPVLIPINYSHAGSRRAHPLFEALPTQTSQQSLALATPPLLLSLNYPNQSAKPVTSPISTITTTRPIALATPPFVITMNQYPDKPGVHASSDPLRTITGAPARFALTMPPAFLATLYGTSRVADLDQALGTVTAGGGNHALVTIERLQAFLQYYYGQHSAGALSEPVHTLRTVEHAAIVEAGGGASDQISVEDCRFRMLKPHELQRAQAFDDLYVILGTVRERVKQIGQANPPPTMKLLIERALESLH